MKTRLKSLICGLLITLIFIALTSFEKVYGMQQKSDREKILDVVNAVAMSADHRDLQKLGHSLAGECQVAKKIIAVIFR